MEIHSFEEMKREREILKMLDIENPAVINLKKLRKYFHEENLISKKFKNSIRPTIWKLFLNYIPTNKFKIEGFLKSRRKLYHEFVNKNYKKNRDKNSINEDLKRTILSKKENKKCDFLDNQFFKERVNFSKFIFLDKIEKHELKKENETNRKIISRILEINLSLNPLINYIQGLHLVIIPIYYVFSESRHINDFVYAEEDAFFCLINLMAQLTGVFGSSNFEEMNIKIEILFKKTDFALYLCLKNNDFFKKKLYLKHVLTLFHKDFEILDLIILYDYIFLNSNRPDRKNKKSLEEIVFSLVVGLYKLNKNKILINEDKFYEVINGIKVNVSDLLRIEKNIFF